MTPEQIEKERQAFEHYISVTHTDRQTGVLNRDWKLKRDGGSYFLRDPAISWRAWLARASLPAWVSVNDALPEMETPVHAVFNGHVGVFVRSPDDEGGWLWARCYGCSSLNNWGEWIQDDDYQSITHWQPLPKPPKGE